MKDFLGNDVFVGSEVVCIEKDYCNLVKGTVIKITNQGMKVNYKKSTAAGGWMIKQCTPEQVMLIIKQPNPETHDLSYTLLEHG